MRVSDLDLPRGRFYSRKSGQKWLTLSATHLERVMSMRLQWRDSAVHTEQRHYINHLLLPPLPSERCSLGLVSHHTDSINPIICTLKNKGFLLASMVSWRTFFASMHNRFFIREKGLILFQKNRFFYLFISMKNVNGAKDGNKNALFLRLLKKCYFRNCWLKVLWETQNNCYMASLKKTF